MSKNIYEEGQGALRAKLFPVESSAMTLSIENHTSFASKDPARVLEEFLGYRLPTLLTSGQDNLALITLL